MRRLTIADDNPERLYGVKDDHLRYIERRLRVSITARGNNLTIEGSLEAEETADRLLCGIDRLMSSGFKVGKDELRIALQVLEEQPLQDLVSFFTDETIPAEIKRFVMPRNLAQRRFIQAMQNDDYVFAIGPAGTGKTFLAVAMAVAALVDEQVRRIVLTRPAVEAGERLGFLPGDLFEKINPYLRPVYDALHDLLGYEKVQRLMDRGAIEIAPLAFMRGRTLGDAFIILDEAQNTTREQMKMFLTRVGLRSKTVITGDITQIDLPGGRRSGLIDALEVLDGVEGIGFIRFSHRDVVRHRLVQRIVDRYQRVEAAAERQPAGLAERA